MSDLTKITLWQDVKNMKNHIKKEITHNSTTISKDVVLYLAKSCYIIMQNLCNFRAPLSANRPVWLKLTCASNAGSLKESLNVK